MIPARMMSELAAALPENAMVVDDAISNGPPYGTTLMPPNAAIFEVSEDRLSVVE